MENAFGNVVVFLGPSYPVHAAAEIIAADFRPPARRDDIFRLLSGDVEVIVLLDGVFHRDPSIGHREILAAVNEGITVIGACSMGALRASELHDIGVLGCGTVFEWYRDGVIDADDEVALLHETVENGYRPLSEPLVNIRATLRNAVNARCISIEQAEALLEEARAEFYPGRTIRGLIHGQVMASSDASRAALTEYIDRFYVDVKAQDARTALHLAKVAAKEQATQRRPSVMPSRRRYSLDTMDFPSVSARLFYRRNGQPREFSVLTAAVRQSPLHQNLMPLLRARWFVLRWAEGRKLKSSRDGIERIKQRLLSRVLDERSFLRRNSLTAGEYAGWVDRQARFEWIIEQHPHSLGLVWGERQRVIDSTLFQDAAPGLREARTILVDWGKEQGLSAPVDMVASLGERWNAIGGALAGDAAILSDLALANWLTSGDPEGIGFRSDDVGNLILELQATDRIADILA